MNLSDLDNQSLILLAQQAPGNLLTILQQPFNFVTNFFVVITILCTPALRTKSLFLVATLSIVEMLSSTVYAGVYLKKYLLHVLGIPETTTQLICFFNQGACHVIGDLQQIVVLALAVDRFICIKAPVFYKTTNTTRYVLLFNLICIGIEFCTISYAYATVDHALLVPVCTRATSFSSQYLLVNSIKGVIVLVLTIIIYTTLASIMYRRYKKTKTKFETERSSWRRQLDFDVFFGTMLVGGISIFVYGAFIVSAIFSGNLQIAAVMVILVAVFNFLNSISHFFVYLKVNEQFRRAFSIVVLKKNQTMVVSLQTAASNKSVSTKKY